MLIFLFLLFAETVSTPDIPLENDSQIERIKSVHSREFGSVDRQSSSGTLTLFPVMPEFNDTLGSSSSPRDLTPIGGSPRTSWSKNN